MVTTPSMAADYESKRQKLTLEKAKVVTLSKQLQIRLQYARLKVEHGWQRQSLNEVENLYFHHSALKGKSKASRPSSSVHASALGTAASASGSPSKATSGPTKDGKAAPETNRAAPPVSVVLSPGAVATSSSPTVAASPHDTLPSQPSTPVKSPSSRTTKSALTPSGTPAQKRASESARSATHSPSVLSAFTQNYTATQPLSRAATMDFSSLSPFVAASSLSSSSSSITTPSSFVSTVPPSPFTTQTLAYMPSPFAPPPSSSVPMSSAPSLPMSQFTAPAYPVVIPTSDMSASLATFPPTPQTTFPSLVRTQSHSPSPTLVSPPVPPPVHSPAPAPSPVSKRIHSPALAATPPPAQKPPPSAPVHTHPPASLSSFRPSKTFDIPTAPGPVTSTVGAGTQSTTMLTYDSFWSSHSSSAGGWRRAIVSSGGGNSSAAASVFTSGITANTPTSSVAGGSGLGVGGNSAKA